MLLLSRISVRFQLIISEAFLSWSIDLNLRCAARWLRHKTPLCVEVQIQESDASDSST